MTTSNRNLLAIALATALLSPAASAGQGGGKGPPDIPQTVSNQGVVSESMPTTNPPERTMGEVRKAEATALYDDVTPKPTAEEIEMRRVERAYRAAAQAAGHPDRDRRREIRRARGKG